MTAQQFFCIAITQAIKPTKEEMNSLSTTQATKPTKEEMYSLQFNNTSNASN